MKRGFALALVACWCAGCIAADTAQRTADETAGSLLEDSIVAGIASFDEARALAVVLADSLGGSPDDARAPVWLWTSGVALLRRAERIDRDSPDTAFALRHPDWYRYFEPGALYAYSGSHLEELVRRFPMHPLADDAFWLYSREIRWGECEGYFACYLDAAVGPMSAFLMRYPHSEFAEEALHNADSTSAFLLTLLDSARAELPPHDTAQVTRTLAQFDSAVARVPALLQPRAAAVAAAIRTRLARRPR